jgi:hypothetical protein
MPCLHHFVLVVAVVFAFAGLLNAAPKITNMPIRGLQVGATTTVTIVGSELLPDSKLVSSFPIAGQNVLEASTANSLQVEVTLDANVTPGMYNLRVMNKNGISAAIVVAVDKLPQLALQPEITSLPVAFHGTVSASTIIKTTLNGKAGEEFIAEVEATRLGGKLRPVLHLYDARRRQIALAMPSPSLHGDARLIVKLPANGIYTLELHDLHYATPAPNYYRLKVGNFQFADAVFPPAVERGKTANLQLVGNVGTDDAARVDLKGDGNVQPAPWPAGSNPTGLRPPVITSELREVVEERTEQQLQELPSAPVAVSGRLDVAGQEDIYRVTVPEGKKIRFEVFADRIQSPIDSLLEIRNDKGARLGLNDDTTNTTDSMLEYKVAKGVAVVDISIKDQITRGSKNCIYRLVITEVGDSLEHPTFALKVSADTHNIPTGSQTVFQVSAKRSGYEGAIKIEVENLPPGLKVTASDIAAGSDGTLVTIEGNSSDIAGVVTKIRGTSVAIDPPLSSVAVFDKHPLGNMQPWLRNDIGLALGPANEAAEFNVEWSEPHSESMLVLGKTIKASLKFARPARQIGPVRLSLVVGEPIPVVNNRPDANRAVRAAKATVDVPIDAKAKAALDAVVAAEKVLSDSKAKIAPAEKVRDDAQAKFAAAEKVANEAKSKVAAMEKVVSDTKAMVAAVEKTFNEAKAKTDKPAGATDDAANEADIAALKKAAEELANSKAALKTSEEKLVVELAAMKTADQKLQTETAATKAAEAKLAADEAVVKTADEKLVTTTTALQEAEKNIKNMAEFDVIIPPNLDISVCDLSLKAELRTVDNKRVLATVYTPVRRFVPLNPLQLKFAGEPKFTGKLDAKQGVVVALKGTIERKAGFDGDVTVSIVGQPGGVAVPKVVLKVDQKEFNLELKFPANFKPATIDTIKVFATGPPIAKTANIVVRHEVPITVDIQAADPIEPATPTAKEE